MQIQKFSISNYRSLLDFKIDEFDSTTIFYGENNAGKSNVLNALHTIFTRKKKLLEDGTYSAFENFYEGIIEKFSNNFYNNEYSKNIEFEVSVSVGSHELTLEKSISKLSKNGIHTIDISGVVISITADIAEIFTTNIKLDGREIFIHDLGTKVLTYFPHLDKDKKNQSELRKAFGTLIDPLNDCIHIINSDRDMHVTAFGNNVEADKITPGTFKNFLHSLYLSPSKHSIFEEINSTFSAEPFNFGTISFAHYNGTLEIMIKNGEVRLPIKHVGSGVLQTLYIISNIIHHRSRIICLEELEQNLSPKKQYQIIRKIQSMVDQNLRKTLHQIIISSHSSVYAKPKLGAIYLLEKENGSTKVEKRIVKQVGKKLKEHLQPAAFEYTEEEFKEIEKYVRLEHDYK